MCTISGNIFQNWIVEQFFVVCIIFFEPENRCYLFELHSLQAGSSSLTIQGVPESRLWRDW